MNDRKTIALLIVLLLVLTSFLLGCILRESPFGRENFPTSHSSSTMSSSETNSISQPTATPAIFRLSGDGLVKILQRSPSNETVMTIAWSPDGQTLAAGLWDSEIVLWDVETGRVISTLEGHRATVRDVDWSPNGMRLASASDDHTIMIWDGTTGERLRVLEGHEDNVYRVAWSSDGTKLASGAIGAADGNVIVWNATTGESARVIAGYADGSVLEWLPNSVMLAFQSGAISDAEGPRIVLWNVETGEIAQTFESYPCLVADVSFSPDGMALASGSYDGTVIVWDVETGQKVFVLRSSHGGVNHVAWSPDGTFLASSSEDGEITLWDATTGEALRTFSGYCVAWSPDGTMLASCLDGRIAIWDIGIDR